MTSKQDYYQLVDDNVFRIHEIGQKYLNSDFIPMELEENKITLQIVWIVKRKDKSNDYLTSLNDQITFRGITNEMLGKYKFHWVDAEGKYLYINNIPCIHF